MVYALHRLEYRFRVFVQNIYIYFSIWYEITDKIDFIYTTFKIKGSKAHIYNPSVCCRAIYCDSYAINLKTFPHNRSKSIVCDSPSVCDNKPRAADLKICTQAYIIHVLVGIVNGLYRFTVSGISHIFTSEFWGFGNLQPQNRYLYCCRVQKLLIQNLKNLNWKNVIRRAVAKNYLQLQKLQIQTNINTGNANFWSEKKKWGEFVTFALNYYIYIFF